MQCGASRGKNNINRALELSWGIESTVKEEYHLGIILLETI